MADNDIWIVYMYHIFIHGSKVFSYFSFNKNNFMSDQIKEYSKTNLNQIKVERNIIKAKEKTMV